VSLSEYRRKRNAKLTPEPFESGGRRRKKPIFVVQRHDARRLHYDFRLERNGALASWAVPKGVPLEPGVRALAVHVEDHPLSYATFHGEIPKGQYGAGSVEIWDTGVYDLLEEKPDGQLTVRLAGKKLRGVWSLVPARLDGKEQNWLLLKHAEAPADGPRRTYSPMLATLDDHVPAGDDWLFEVKFDGYRALAYVGDGSARLLSRTGNDLTERFASVAMELGKATNGRSAVIDGEVCRLDSAGRSSFSELQQGSGPLVFYAFDLLELDGKPLVDEPLVERKAELEQLLDGRNRAIRFSSDFDDGEALLAAAREQELEGLIAKRRSSRYANGRRTRDWRKIKLHAEQEFVVAGYTTGTGHRSGTFGALVLGLHEDGELRYVGNVGTGFTDRELAKLLALLKPLARDGAPFATLPKMPRVRHADVHWVEPRLVVQVRFSEWTHDGHLRQPSYVGLRDDKRAADVTR
jgi:bifunctional non-homologous end joining protein LigD